MNGHISKPWDWSKNTDGIWLIPCMESAYLAERWRDFGFKRFLDLGCGLGRHTVYMAKKGFDVTAADLSDYGINHVIGWAQKENLNINTAVCDMTKLPFADNGFDCIMAYNVIYHTDTEGFLTALSEIQRALRPGGELFLTLISKNTYSFQNARRYKRLDGNTLLRDEHETEKDVPHFYVDIADIKRLFSEWDFQAPPAEWCEYDTGKPESYSKHWTLLVRKREES